MTPVVLGDPEDVELFWMCEKFVSLVARGVVMTLEEVMVKVWRQALVEGAAEVELDGKTFTVRETPRKRLREVDFVFDGQPLRGLEQNPKTESRWAQLARAGHKVMQFLSAGRYVGNVADGKVTLYGGQKKKLKKTPRWEEAKGGGKKKKR